MAIDGNELCAEVEITGFGTFDCITNAVEIVAGGNITVTIDGVYSNSSFVAGDVTYSQHPSITVSGIEIVGSTVIFTGTGFPTDSYGSSTIQGLPSDSVSIDSSVSLSASFATTGIPTAEELPNLVF